MQQRQQAGAVAIDHRRHVQFGAGNDGNDPGVARTALMA
jgi:hypothetical protein